MNGIIDSVTVRAGPMGGRGLHGPFLPGSMGGMS